MTNTPETIIFANLPNGCVLPMTRWMKKYPDVSYLWIGKFTVRFLARPGIGGLYAFLTMMLENPGFDKDVVFFDEEAVMAFFKIGGSGDWRECSTEETPEMLTTLDDMVNEANSDTGASFTIDLADTDDDSWEAIPVVRI